MSSGSVALPARIIPGLPSGGRLCLRLLQRNLVVARKQWLIIISGLFEPVFYLVGLGIGVGALIGTVEIDGRTVPYQDFAAPAMLAAAAMNGAVYESTINIFAKLKWQKTYEGVLATPLGVRDVALGEVIYALMRGTLYAIGFMIVMAALGLVESVWAVLAVPAAVLIGAAFASVGLIVVTVMRSWADFGFIEVATLPLFLFSATFVPYHEYPEAVQWILPLTPLYHGVELIRALTLGTVDVSVLLHVAYLVAMLGIGLTFAGRRLERLLVK